MIMYTMKKFIHPIYTYILQREYRPAPIFRIPMFFIWWYFAIKARHPFFFTIVNPSIPGGFMRETKSSVYELLDNKAYPRTISFAMPVSVVVLQDMMQAQWIWYPCILKPDGDSVRWNNVYKIENDNMLSEYLAVIDNWPYLIQEYIGWEEYSVYYYRYPYESSGHILWVTKKIYPRVFWDWLSSLWVLLQNHDRYKRYIELFRDVYKVSMDEVIPLWVEKQIASIGNHSKWSLFVDYSSHSNQQLTHVFDTLFAKDAQVYLYRVDIKTPTWNDLLQWTYSILEVNSGVFAEPTYMYDPDYKLLHAYKQIYKVRYHTFKIATYNHTIKKISYMSLSEWRKNIIHFMKK